MSGTDARPRALRLRQAVVLGLAALFLAAALAGCSDDAPPETPDAVTGKTPVVRPEDVHVRGTGGAAVLAPDYRQGLTADLPADAEFPRQLAGEGIQRIHVSIEGPDIDMPVGHRGR